MCKATGQTATPQSCPQAKTSLKHLSLQDKEYLDSKCSLVPVSLDDFFGEHNDNLGDYVSVENGLHIAY